MHKVSVVIPVYNSQAYIAACLESVLNQTYRDIEVVVVNDSSTDQSIDVISEYLADDRVKLLHTIRNSGVCAARNLGIDRASGRYIAFCDSDDYWAEEKLEIQLQKIKVNNACASHTSVYYLKKESETLVNAKERVSLEDMRSRNWIANSSGLYDIHKVGKIFQKPHRHEDYEMWCDVLRIGGVSVGVTQPLAMINRRDGSVSANKYKSVLWHIKAQRRIFSMSYPEVILRMAENVSSRLLK